MDNQRVRPEKVENLFRITTDRMFAAVESFSLWKKINMMRNANEVGKDQAERNVGIFNKNWDVFHTILSSTYKSFVIDLSIFFDSEKFEDTFSLKKLINVVKEKVTDEEFDKLIKEIDELKKKHGVRIAFILELRNTTVSHQEIDRKSRLIIYKEIDELFKCVQEILNLLSKYYDESITIWDHIEKNVSGGLEFIIDNLERGEQVRLDEIKKKYGTF